MLELMFTIKSDSDPLMDIDFSRQNIGDTNIIDWTGHHTFSKLITGTKGSVINDPIMGKVLDTNGTMWATPDGQFADLRQISFRLEVVYKAPTAVKSNLWCTGGWNGQRISGMTLQANAVKPGDVNIWVDDSFTYKSLDIPGTGTSDIWETATLTVLRHDQITLKLKSTGMTKSIPYTPPGRGQKMSIAGWYGYINGTPYMLDGMIKSIKLDRLF